MPLFEPVTVFQNLIMFNYSNFVIVISSGLMVKTCGATVGEQEAMKDWRAIMVLSVDNSVHVACMGSFVR